MKTLLAVTALCVAMTGCAGSKRASPGSTAPRASSSNEADGVAAAMKQAEAARTAYKLAPDDVVAVTVYQDKDVNVRTHVDSDGTISLPLAGVVQVGGATVADAQKRIAERLDRYYVKPTVSLVVESQGTKQLFVLGEVQKPGPIPVPAGGTVTLLQAITDAGGFTKAAAPKRTHVLRYADGRSQDYKVDLKGLIKSGDRQKDMALEANDVIYVPQAMF